MYYGKQCLRALLLVSALIVTIPSFAAYTGISNTFKSCSDGYSVWVLKTPEATPAYAYYKLKLSGNKISGYLLKLAPNATDINVAGSLEQGVLTMFGINMEASNDHEFAPTQASPTTGRWTSNLLFIGCAQH